MFVDNKYSRWYFSIVSKSLSKDVLIYEKHHIIPKSLGGSNDPQNIRNLTPREHFICHKLLVKMTIGEDQIKMKYAFWSMTRNTVYTHRNISSKDYELARQSFIELRKGKTYDQIYGSERSAIIRKKLSDASIGVPKPWAGSDGINEKTGHNRAAKIWDITTPDGEVLQVVGSEFTHFCRKHNLSKGNFSRYGKTKGFSAKCLGLASEFLQ
jgi:hypothetical protein